MAAPDVIGAPGVVSADSATGQIDETLSAEAADAKSKKQAASGASKDSPNTACASAAAGGRKTQQAMSGQGAQFIFVAATVANILCDNLSQTQINLLANFLSVVTTCVYAILTVENPTDVLEA